MKQGTSGELFGYGYLPLPLTAPKKATAGKDVPTGDQCWTLFLSTGNFKGPVTFFVPYFWSKPTVEKPDLGGLFLDTRPYNAHVTASDALWAGLPLVTCRGDAFPGRVAASLLDAAGLPELVTASWEDYERLALALAADPGRLAGIRERLVRNRASCSLFDTDRFRRHLESAYRTMHERAQRGESPAGFDVAPLS